MNHRLSTRAAATFLERLAEILGADMSLPEALESTRTFTRDPGVAHLAEQVHAALEQRQGLDPALPVLRAALGPGAGELLVWAHDQGRLEAGVRVLARIERHRATHQRRMWASAAPVLLIAVVLALPVTPYSAVGWLLLVCLSVLGPLGLALSAVGEGRIEAERVHEWLDRQLWQLAPFDRWIRPSETLRLLWCLSLAVHTGTPIAVALERARGTMTNLHAVELARRVEGDIARGATLGNALQAHIPLTAQEHAIVANGEESGRLAEALTQVTRLLAARLDLAAKRTAGVVVAVPYALFLLSWLVVLAALAC